ncbi:MAG: hypothetical protein KDK44_00235 [Chlamydiia bacterium]|nr:hypothetical protein [Chlamydiia bacterium]MCP5510184.1 hypothetical protein [Chlamydiales bacterium]HPE85091.1 hypothetical protein [Chlamydiales bacterium]
MASSNGTNNYADNVIHMCSYGCLALGYVMLCKTALATAQRASDIGLKAAISDTATQYMHYMFKAEGASLEDAANKAGYALAVLACISTPFIAFRVYGLVADADRRDASQTAKSQPVKAPQVRPQTATQLPPPLQPERVHAQN